MWRQILGAGNTQSQEEMAASSRGATWAVVAGHVLAGSVRHRWMSVLEQWLEPGS